MADMGDVFRAMNEDSKHRRNANRESSTEFLIAEGIPFIAKNLGDHLIVTAGNETIDFYPSTGLWIVRTTKHRARGVRKLIKYIKEKDK